MRETGNRGPDNAREVDRVQVDSGTRAVTWCRGA